MKSKIKGVGLNETTQWDVIKSVYLHTFYIYRYLCVDKYKTRYTVMIKGRLFPTVITYCLLDSTNFILRMHRFDITNCKQTSSVVII